MDEKDKELFRDSIGAVSPVKSRGVAVDVKKPKPAPKQKIIENRNALKEMSDGPLDSSTLKTGDELLYCRPGFQKKPFKKLRKGQYTVEDTLDLHGHISTVAKQKLVHFLQHCHARQYRCIKIIHGKGLGSKDGKPVIKTRLNDWLQQRKDVLAFCSARPEDGGTGAIYLLLRQRTRY